MKKTVYNLFMLSSILFALSCNSPVKKSETNSKNDSIESGNTQSGSNGENSNNKTKLSQTVEIYNLVNELPGYGDQSRITFPENDYISVQVENSGKSVILTELKNVPEAYLTKQNEKIKSIEGGYLSENKSIAELKSDMARNQDHPSFPDGLEISFMVNLDIDTKYTTILSLKTETKNGEPEDDEWTIYSISPEGKIISELNRFSDFLIHDNQILSIWFYASDPYPMYELWQLNKEGIFEMISSEKNPPSWYKK